MLKRNNFNFMRLPINKIKYYCIKYDKRYLGTNDEKTEKELKKHFLSKHYLNRQQLIKLCLWKSKRPQKHYKDIENDDLAVKEITKFALSCKSEVARIKALTMLKGVSWPVASVILHFAYPNKYPILDFRAIWSLAWPQPKKYDCAFWSNYIKEIKKIAKNNKVSLRTLDKALWYYSKENQK